MPAAYLMIIIDETHQEEGNDRVEMDTKGWLIEPRLEGRWDKMEKEERSIQQQ